MQSFVTRSLAIVLTALMVSTTLATTIVKPVDAPLVESVYPGREAIYSYNGAGLTSDLVTGDPVPVTYPGHSFNPTSSMWHSSGPVATTWIVYDLGANYLLSGSHIWNFNESGGFITRHAKDITISFSTTSPSTGFGTPYPFTLLQTPGTTAYTGETKSLGEIIEARYARVDILTHYTAANDYTGLSEIRFLSPGAGTLSETPDGGSELTLVYKDPLQPTIFTDVITLENTGGPDTAVAITGYSITGLDAAQFDLSNFAPAFLGSGDSVEFDVEFTPLFGQSVYNAQLTLLTNLGNLVYQLSAVPQAPEPNSMLLLLGVLGCGMLRRRKENAKKFGA